MKHLEESLTAELSAKGMSLQGVKNQRTAVNGWLREFGLTEESAVGAEMGPQFSSQFYEHSATLEGEGKTKQTIGDRKYLLSRFREAWLELLQTTTAVSLEGDFMEALNRLIAGSDLTLSEICSRAGNSITGLRYWRIGEHMPMRKNVAVIARLEEIFGLPYGALMAKLPKMLTGDTVALGTGQTGYRDHLRSAHASPYYLKQLPTRVQSEWGRLFKFCTDAAWVRAHGLQRGTRWRVREHDNACPTAERAYAFLRKFFGYLCLPVNKENATSGGQGFAPESLTIALLSDNNLVYDYLQFKKKRTYLERYNSDTRYAWQFCSSLIRSEKGF